MKLRSFPSSTYAIGLLMFLVGCAAATKIGLPPAGQKYLTKIAMWMPHGGASLYRTSGLPGTAISTAGLARPMAVGDPAATIAMSFSGVCDGVTALPAGGRYIFYGMGAIQQNNGYCQQLGEPNPDGSIGPFGIPVVGAGSLSTLRVYVASNAAGLLGDTVSIYVNGKPTAIKCTIANGPNGLTMCADDTDTASVSDNDLIAAVLDVAPNQTAYGIRVLLGKQ